MARRRLVRDVAYKLLKSSFITTVDFQIAGRTIKGSSAPYNSASTGLYDSLLKSVA
jgi:hypothetical protein